MPISPPVGGPVPNLGVQEIEITDKEGKFIGTEKIQKRPLQHSDKIPLYAKVMAITIVLLLVIYLISLII